MSSNPRTTRASKRRPETPSPGASTGPRIGLVLGGGAAAGLAFHAGVLWALSHDLGWDARSADVVVGTSAGSIIGALLRSDVPPADLAAWASDARPSRAGLAFRRAMDQAETVVTRGRVPLPPRPSWASLRALASPSQLPAAMATMLPHGLYDHTPQLAVLDRIVTEWPEAPLWISAVRVGDGRVAWFGRDDDLTTGVLPADAVRASCAIPVLARPVKIGRHRYLDGGVRSATHADVLADLDLDHVIVLSPMGERIRSRNVLRVVADRAVRREVAALERAGIPVTLISPDLPTSASMGLNLMDRSRTTTVMRQAFLGTIDQIAPATMDLLRAAAPAA